MRRSLLLFLEDLINNVTGASDGGEVEGSKKMRGRGF